MAGVDDDQTASDGLPSQAAAAPQKRSFLSWPLTVGAPAATEASGAGSIEADRPYVARSLRWSESGIPW